MIDEAIRRGDIKLAPASEKHVKMANDVQNDFYNKLIGLGMNEQEALSASILMKNFALKRTVSPERFKNWYDKIVVTNKPQSQVGAVMQNALHQSANVAGVNSNNEIANAKKEWEEKGTDSKYFKKWFGDSKVVDESGKPLVVYHGTESDEAFSIFETNSPDGTPAIYFSNNKKVANSYSVNLPIFEVYLKMENPLEIDAQGKEYNDFIAEMRSNIDYANRNGYDGVIVKNIRDGWSQDKGGKVATTYVVFKPEQIKSVNNKGTFNKNNPNIYHQKEIKNFDDMLIEFSNDIEKTPDDYKINNLNEALKDLKISEDKPKEIKTPFETIQVRARNIEHIIDRKDDKARYKSINKMFATLERPNIIIKREDDSRGYFKIFENNNKNKKQIVYVSTDKLGNFVLTTIPVKRNKKFIDAINQGNIIYDSRKGVINNSPDNTIITDSSNNFNPDNTSFQSAPGTIEETIQDKFGCSIEELTENIKQDIISTLSDYDVSDSEFSIQDIKLYGSYSKGTNKATSDLDFIVQYDGSMREDSAFNILHDVEHTIEDKDGNKVLIDINPINVNESGTIDEHVEYMNSLDDNNAYFQSAYHGTPHRFDEFSLDAIGTGEGAQAHGWGLYFAGDKNVSENYRQELARINNLDLFGSVPVDVYYDGKHATEYNPSADFSLALELVGTQDKKAGIDYLKNEINKCQKRIDEFKEDMKKRPMDTPAFKQQIEDEQDYISELNKQIDFINNLDVNKLEVEKRNQGQLFEVDIPENDVLLDEDKELIHQPDKVQRVIEKIYADAMKSNNVELTNAIGITGKEIYRGFSKYFGSDKKASEFLNSYGIKGITYDGRQDGRCYVIFDDKAVNVIKTYYQSMLSGIDKDQKVNVLDLTSAFGSDANLSKKDLTNYIKSLIGSNPISTSDKKAIVNFIARSKRTGKGNVYIPSHIANSSKVETNNKGVRNTVVNNIVDLIKNSVLIDKSENRDKQTKPNVDYYYRCYVPVRVNNDIYTVRITLENNEKDNLFNIINGNVYDVIIDKKMTSAHSMTNSQSSLMKSSSNSNIPQNNKNITSDQITIEDMLKDVLDAEGNTYYQSDSEDVIREKLSNENIQNKIDELSQRIEKLAEEESELDNTPIIEAMLVDIERLENFMAGDNSNLDIIKKIMGVNEEKGVDLGQAIGKYKARKEQEIQNYRGYFVESDKVNILGIGQMSDSSTIIHELGHLFLNGMNEFAKYDEVSKRQLDAINNWLGYNGVAYTRAQHEKFECLFVL